MKAFTFSHTGFANWFANRTFVKSVVFASAVLIFIVAFVVMNAFTGAKPSSSLQSDQNESNSNEVYVKTDITPLESNNGISDNNSAQNSYSSSASSEPNQNSTNTQIIVNGEEIQVPENGTVHEEITNSGNTNTVEVDIQSQTSGQSGDDGSTRVRTDLRSRTTIKSSETQKEVVR